jgi:septal ring factor EnvC (AmiA/AmiB activator)
MMWRRLVFGSCLLFALSLALWSQDQSSTSPSSSPAISSLEIIKKQMLNLQANIADYKTTIETLKAQLQILQAASEIDKTLLTKLQAQLTDLGLALIQAQTLSKQLSTKYQNLAISYETARLFNKIAIPTAAILAVTLVASILTRGFTR